MSKVHEFSGVYFKTHNRMHLSGTLRLLVTISFTLQKINKIISIIKTNSCRHSEDDSAFTGLAISLFSGFRSCTPQLPQILNIYSVGIAVVMQYVCI